MVLCGAGFVAFQLGRNEVTLLALLGVATAVALVVAVQLVPNGPAFIRRPEQIPDEVEIQKISLQPVARKRVYSSPHVTQFESREISEPAWELPGEDESFRVLRPFYLVHPGRNFTPIAASLKFSGDNEFRSWQPVANSSPQPPDAGNVGEPYEWILIGYVPPNAYFDTRLQLRDSRSRMGVVVLRDLVAAENRPFHSVHLKILAL